MSVQGSVNGHSVYDIVAVETQLKDRPYAILNSEYACDLADLVCAVMDRGYTPIGAPTFAHPHEQRWGSQAVVLVDQAKLNDSKLARQ